jgi:hypothetical protein
MTRKKSPLVLMRTVQFAAIWVPEIRQRGLSVVAAYDSDRIVMPTQTEEIERDVYPDGVFLGIERDRGLTAGLIAVARGIWRW